MSQPKQEASSTEGFFQEAPHVSNQFWEDASWRRAMLLFLPPEAIDIVSPDLSSFGARVLTREIQLLVKDAEQTPPRLETWDTFGRRKDELITSHGWKQLQAIGIHEGIVAIPFEGQFTSYSRVYQFLKYHLWSASSALVTCPSAMTDGAAALLKRHLQREGSVDGHGDRDRAARSAYARLTSRDPTFAWTSGQWMTERAGGSDVSNTETRARTLTTKSSPDDQPAADGSALGNWSIDGFKWFSSATDADMTVLLAKTPSTRSAGEELSAFFAPTRLENLAFNGIGMQRLKNKLGTRSLPTAELELKGMRAHLLGQQGQGVRQIATVLNITRVHNAVAAMGGWGRGLAVARAFASVRRIHGRLLTDVPAHMRDLAHEHVKYRAYMLFTYFVVALLGAADHHADTGDFTPFLGVQSAQQAAVLLRLLTPVLKATTALAAIHGLRWVMESLGGVGYLENEDPVLNVARLFRDANVLAIWEGTTKVMAEDTVRTLRQKGGDGTHIAFEALSNWAHTLCAQTATKSDANENIRGEVERLCSVLGMDAQTLLYHGQDIMTSIETIVSVCLLQQDYLRTPNDRTTEEILDRWRNSRPGKPMRMGHGLSRRQIEEAIRLDQAIVFENSQTETRSTTSRL